MIIRDAIESDLEAICGLLIDTYGKSCVEFYDTTWLKRSIYSDNVIFLVIEIEGTIVSTAMMTLSVGQNDDMIGELARFAVIKSDEFLQDYYTELIKELTLRAEETAHLLIVEVLSRDTQLQKILEELGWASTGFIPMKHFIEKRESVLCYTKHEKIAFELRRNNPHLIPEAADLGKKALEGAKLDNDIIVEIDVDAFTTAGNFQIDCIPAKKGVAAFFRVQRNSSVREIFGNFAFSHSFFRISNLESQYITAKEGEHIIGVLGFTEDPIDQKIRVFELIGFENNVKGVLLDCLNNIAEQIGVDYVEIDVSAYEPKIQRTLERMGFVPVAYFPSMVFNGVERLDVLRMVQIRADYKACEYKLSQKSEEIKNIVCKNFVNREKGIKITETVRASELFLNIAFGDLYHLASIAKLQEYKEGEVIVQKGQDAEKIYILLEGGAEVLGEEKTFGELIPGNIFGEMALLEECKRNASVKLTQASKIIEIKIADLKDLLEKRPGLSGTVGMNLARSLSRKLRKANIDLEQLL